MGFETMGWYGRFEVVVGCYRYRYRVEVERSPSKFLGGCGRSGCGARIFD